MVPSSAYRVEKSPPLRMVLPLPVEWMFKVPPASYTFRVPFPALFKTLKESSRNTRSVPSDAIFSEGTRYRAVCLPSPVPTFKVFTATDFTNSISAAPSTLRVPFAPVMALVT